MDIPDNLVMHLRVTYNEYADDESTGVDFNKLTNVIGALSPVIDYVNHELDMLEMLGENVDVSH
jgi:hypothetical protein